MARKRYTAEQIIGMLREAEVGVAGGTRVIEIVRSRRRFCIGARDPEGGCQQQQTWKLEAARHQFMYPRLLRRLTTSGSSS
jgi:hypothetical protein